jgi:hypothetical protein
VSSPSVRVRGVTEERRDHKWIVRRGSPVTAREGNPLSMIVIGVDPHKSTHTTAAVDPVTNTDLGSLRIEAAAA